MCTAVVIEVEVHTLLVLPPSQCLQRSRLRSNSEMLHGSSSVISTVCTAAVVIEAEAINACMLCLHDNDDVYTRIVVEIAIVSRV